MALEQHQVALLAHLVNEIGFELAQSAVNGVGFHDNGIVSNRLEQVEESVVAVSDAALVIKFVKAVFMLEMNGIGIQFFNLFSHRFPPITTGHVDNGENTVTCAVGMTDHQDFAVWVGFLDKFARLFAEGADTAQPGRIGTDHDNRLIGHERLPPDDFRFL